MHVRTVYFKNFRGLHDTKLAQCSNFNVLIGKNNAGKSSILSAIELAFAHLKAGRPATQWRTKGRQADEFTNRETDSVIQIGLEFAINSDFNTQARNKIREETAGLEVAVDQLSDFDIISVVLGCAMFGGKTICFVKEMGFGNIFSVGDLRVDRKLIFSMPLPVAQELVSREITIEVARRDVTALEGLRDEPSRIEYYLRETPERDTGRFLIRRLVDILGASAARRIEEVFKEQGVNRPDVSTLLNAIDGVIAKQKLKFRPVRRSKRGAP